MLPQSMLENITIHQIIHLENGKRKENLKQLELDQLESIEDTKLKLKTKTKMEIQTIKKKYAMLEYQARNKKKIWKDKLPYSEINTLIIKLSRTLDQVSTSKEKGLKPYSSKQSMEISKKLWLPTKIDSVVSVLSSSNQLYQPPMGKSWFSITTKKPKNKNSLKTSLPSLLFSPVGYTGGEVTEIKETPNKIWTTTNKEKITHKTLRFRLFCNDQEKEELKTMSDQTKWYTNMCKDIFTRKHNVLDLKKEIDKTKVEMKVFLKKWIDTKKIKDVVERKKIQKELKKERPVEIKIVNNVFRDELRKYNYTEDTFGKTTDGKEIVLVDFEYEEKNNKLPQPDWWVKEPHNRVPRGAIKNFVSSLNGNISNYRNNETDFTIKYKTKKSNNETIFFEDKCYPIMINNIISKYCYTTIINGQRKRESISLKEIKNHLDIMSMNIVKEKDTGRYYLNLSVPKEFYLPNDKRNESQGSFRVGSMIALDPGVRTFIMGYSTDKVCSIGDGCCDKIFKLLLEGDSLVIEEGMTKEEKDIIYQKRRLIRAKVKNMVDDLHWKTIKYLSSNYDVIIYPDFRTRGMMKKLDRGTKRKLSAFSFYKFKERLIYKCKSNGNRLIITNEAYTSRTCGKCGFTNPKSRDKIFVCKRCSLTVDRDINGARNISIKTIGMLLPLKPLFTL
jgi:IS605 OrfB family transposase